MFSLIAAIGKNRELGKEGKLLFHLPEDMKYFRKTTMGHKVLMGRKTWESLPGKLSGRYNIVVSRGQASPLHVTAVREPVVTGRDRLGSPVDCARSYEAYDAQPSHDSRAISLDEKPDTVINDLSEFAKQNKDSEEEIFVIGGGMVYWEMMKYAKKLYLTEVDAEAEADTFFPEFDKKDWTRTVIKEGEDDGIKYAFVIYGRK